VLDEIVRDTPPCEGPTIGSGAEPLPGSAIPETKTTTWVEPRLVSEVRYREWTPDGLLRHPACLRMRDDKAPEDCERQDSINPAAEPEDAPPSPIGLGAPGDEVGDVVEDPGRGRETVSADAMPDESSHRGGTEVERTIAFSNLTKVYWPAEGYTKGDLIEYYRRIAPWLLPYLRDRPLVMTRFPDGIDGKSFYQKDAPEFAPSWIRTVPVWSEDTQREIRYFVCDDVESLLYVANLGSIPLHIWASRVGSLELPDWCVIDLDPKEAPFSDVVRTAQVLHRICESLGLPDYVKTTGKTGLHILLPLGRRCTYAQSRTLGELLARLVLRELHDIATITRHVSRRGDKVYLDYLQNRHGQTIVAPFSVRPVPGATVSMPIRWDEVNGDLDPRAFTIRNAVERLERLGADPVRPVLESLPDLGAVLQRLAAMMAEEPGAPSPSDD
jgi:bifunctional non-homologous end joining protein LigD